MSLLNLPFLMPSGGRFSIQDLSPFRLFSCSNLMCHRYLNPDASDSAMDRLALCGDTRVGFFILEQSSIVGLSQFSEVPGRTCPQDGPVRKGQGLEATAPVPVDPGPRRFVSIPKS